MRLDEAFPDLVLVQARLAVRLEDDAESLRRCDALVARYGREAATNAWMQACQEYDREQETQT